MVAKAGGGQVSMSWGGAEFNGQTSFDSHFSTQTVVYFASNGPSILSSERCRDRREYARRSGHRR
jgi:kumamolisin